MNAPVVATIQAVVGNVIAVNQDGDIRVLKTGDMLFQGETIKTAPEANITIRYTSGFSQSIDADANFTLHPTLLNFLTHPTALAHMDPTAIALRTAFLADSDPKKVSAASHDVSSSGDHFAYVRHYADPAADVNSGHLTQGFGTATTSSADLESSTPLRQPEEPRWDESMYTPPFTVSAPISFGLNEAGLAAGSHPDAGETTISQIFSFYAGSDPLTHFAFSTDLSSLATDLNDNGSPDIFWVRVSDIQIQGFLDAEHSRLAITLDLQVPTSIAVWDVGNAEVIVTLNDHLPHAASDSNPIVNLGGIQIEASDGVNTATATMVLGVQDDMPTAVNDVASIAEDATPNIISGNVLDNDQSGADTPKSFAAWSSADGTAIAALNVYGTLTQNSDGTWSYTLDNSRGVTQALTSEDSHGYVLHYTMQDADGSTSDATLTITIRGSDDSASLPDPENIVYEYGLVTNDGSQTATGTLTVVATDGIHDLVIGGVSFTFAEIQAFATTPGVVNTTDGVLTLTNYSGDNFSGTISYNYTLLAAVSNDSSGSSDDTFVLTVNGLGGTTATDHLVIHVMDDAPVAVNDSASVTEDGASNISGNVLSNDSLSADTPAAFVAWGGGDSAAIAALNTYGTLTQNNDGSWNYVLDNSRAATQALTSADSHDYVLHYTMQDADGSTSDATLTITVHGANDSASVVTAQLMGADNIVYEHGLVARDDTQTANGTFNVAATDGIHNVIIGGASFTLAQIQAFAITQGVVNTADGVLTLTNYSGDRFGGTISYSYTLPAAVSNDSSGFFDDSVALTVNGVGGTTAHDNLVVRVMDDDPTLITSMSAVIPNESGTVTGLMTLSAGADGLSSFNVAGPSIPNVVYSQTVQSDGTTTLVGSTSTGANIFSLTLNPDATYTFNLIAPQTTMTLTENLTALTAGNATFKETTDGLIEFSTTSGNSLSVSMQGFGVNDQRLCNGEQFTMEFHNMANLGVDDPVSSSPRYVNAVSLNYDNVNLGNQSNNNFITYAWTALNSSTNQSASGTITLTSSAAGVLMVAPGFDFNLLTIVGTGGISGSGKGARFQTADYTYQVVPSDQSFAFNVTAIDGDGDVTASQVLNVHQIAAGTGGNFTLVGSTGDDTIAGSTHTDTIIGGGGFNIADYSGSAHAVSINLNDSGNASGAPTTFSNPSEGSIGGGDAAGDTLTGLQGLIGSLGNDYLFGNSSDNYLAGGAGNDTLNGEGGNDTLVGGSGNDTLTGGAGQDTFVWQLGDQGTAQSSAIDAVTDFSMAQRDVLNLSSLLNGAATDSTNLDSLLTFTSNGNDTILQVATHAGSQASQQIVLQNVSMSDLAGGAPNPTSADIVSHLLTTHQLVV
jgi:VCBS repeat-containing protein